MCNGDGGFLMTVGELVTARRHGVSFITIVLTDNDLALIRIKQEKRDYPVYGTTVRSGGWLSRGNDVLGVPLEVVRNGAELRESLVRAIEANALTIIEAVVDSSEYDDVVLKKDKA
jgi:acetolactate synthase I/II/III large subunit